MIDPAGEKKIHEIVPRAVFDIATRLREHGYSAFLVGGSIRDLLLATQPNDFDIATDATPDMLLSLFPKSIEVGAKFGTVIVLAPKNGLDIGEGELEEYQVTTFRKDAQYINGRWPESVAFSKTIEEDLSRRDFTINALALDLSPFLDNIGNQHISNAIIDLFDGRKDLKDGIIRAVGDPYERMREDGLRALRACRIASKLEFTIESETFKAVEAASTTVDMLSMERIRDEFLGILETKTPSIGIELLRRAGILAKCIPELLEGVGMEQNEYHQDDVYTHLLATCDLAEAHIRLAALFHDIGKARTKNMGHFYGHEGVGALMTKEILTRLKFPKDVISYTTKLVELHMFNYQSGWSDAAVRRFLAKVGDEKTLKDLFLLRIADAASNPKSPYKPEELREFEERIMKVQAEDHALHIKDLKVNGNDLKEIGITDGPKIGKILNELLERVLDDPLLNDKGKLLALARELA